MLCSRKGFKTAKKCRGGGGRGRREAIQVPSLQIQSLEEIVDLKEVALSLAGEALRIARMEIEEERRQKEMLQLRNLK